jgi:hypothetical protein
VAVTSLAVSGKVKPGSTVLISIGVANQGNQTETFNVSLAVSAGTAGPAKSVTLAAGASSSQSISWTLPNSRGTYSATGSASIVPGETDTADNSKTGTLSVR